MVALPKAARFPTAEAIYAAYVDDNDDTERTYLGASVLGDECERKLWLAFRWAFPPERFEGRMLRLFQSGHREEDRLIADLKRVGVVFDELPGGEQHAVRFAGGHGGGHLDGIIVSGLLEAPAAKHVFEAKTHNTKSFAKLIASGVKSAKPMHYAQMQTYMHLKGIDRAFYVAVEKDTDSIYTERVHLDPVAVAGLLAKASRIVLSDQAPAKISEKPDFYLCRFCAYPGTRNDALNRAALKLGHQVAAGRLGRHEVTQALIAAAQASGLAKDDGMPSVLKTIASGINAGMREPAPPLEDTADRDEAVGAASSAALLRERVDPKNGEIISEPHPAAKGPALRQLPQIVPADLQGQPVPARRWFADDLIPEGTVTSINGDGGTGKSLLALQLAVAASVGGVWLGNRIPRCRALFVTAEDDADECHRRLWSITRAEKMELSELDNLRVSSLVEEPDAVLAAPEPRTRRLQPTALWGALERFVGEWQPKLVVLDTLADLFGGDEIDRAQSRAFIGMLRRLCVQRELTIVLLAHPSVSGMSSGSGSSGSTAWNNSVRSRLYLRRAIGGDGIEDDPDLRVLTTKKANYGPIGAEIKMRWADGRFLAENTDEPHQDPSAAKARVDALFLKLLDDYEAEGRFVGSARSANYAPSVFSLDARAKGTDRRGFESAMNRLFAEKRIRNVEYGPPSKRRMRLTAARKEDVDYI